MIWISSFTSRAKKGYWQKGLVVLICLLLMFAFSTAAFADDPSTNGNSIGTAFTDSSFQAQMEKSMDEANFFERAVMNLINGLFKLAGISPIPELVFGNPYQYWGITSGGVLQYNLFYQKELDTIIKPMILVFTSLYTTFVALAMMLSSLRMGISAHSPQAKADFWKDVQMWIFSALFMGSFWFFFQTLCGMNDAISGAIADTMASNGLKSNSVSVIAAASTNPGVFGLGDIIIYLGEWILTVILNFIYIARKIIVIFLVLLTPFAAYSLLFARTRHFFGIWVKELLGNIFLPCIHGLILYTFAAISALGAGSFFKLGMLIMFIPASGIVSRWLQLGDSTSKLGSALTMSGMSGVAGMMVLGRSAMQMAGGLRRKTGSSANGEGTDELSGNDYGSTAISNAAAKSLTGSGRAIKLAKNSSSVIGGTVGALAGMVAGPGGAMAGGLIGSKIGGGLVASGSSLVTGGIQAGKAISGLTSLAKSGEWSENLAQRRHLMGNLGESFGSMVAGERGGTIGRAAGNAFSMATRRRIQTEQFGGNNPQDYATKFPDTDIYWKADSMKSGFYMNRNGQEALISALGGGIADLKNPVYVPFKTPPKGAIVTRGSNGSYSMTAPSANSEDSGQSTTVTTPNAGLQGSTPSFLRTGEAYTMDSNGQRYAYTAFNASSINVDSYFTHSAPGLKSGTTSGQLLDKVTGTPSVAESRKRAENGAKLRDMAMDYRMGSAESDRVKGIV